MTAGCSHAGDFAHQFHVAYSELVNRGSCVFSGQPYHCAVTKFTRDELVTQTDESSVPRCDGCPPGKTLVYDHCKNHPQFVDVGALPDYVRRSCDDHNLQRDCIDDPDNLFSARIFAFQPTEDRCYIPPAVANVEALYGQLVTNPEKQIKYVDEYPFAHTLPTNSTAFWNSSEPAGYDGPGECLRHVFDEEMFAGEFKARNVHIFDQTEFFVIDPPELASNGTGLNHRGVMYLPDDCEEEQCRMLILASGCGGNFPTFGGADIDFIKYADSNRIVVVKPCVGGYFDAERFPNAAEVSRGLLDVYGQLSDDYAWQSGFHMKVFGRIIKRLVYGDE
eukprot:CAMPEP_0118640538 /NCGR_PEP_ID=MMETSP0785-20121206/4807_1 /TAXON_ID=91992 /ORGANISM="Bolidomonas pacifica, Strain CCMP 1866" /LENGTH=333 /DNA_ID=CAMNT_0006531933 /DNA_START=123 /DNA_END=1124 /DNA_ORIENTATION=-